MLFTYKELVCVGDEEARCHCERVGKIVSIRYESGVVSFNRYKAKLFISYCIGWKLY